jgi:hypothetical protein
MEGKQMAIVRIDTSGKVIEGDRRIRISKYGQGQINWISQFNSGPWTVIFPAGPPPYIGSPFESSTFIVPQVGSVSSGSAIVLPGGAEYKYEVRNSAGEITDDPDVIIDA